MRHRKIFFQFIYLLSICVYIQAKNVGINLPCNKELDGLLAQDPDGNESAFMSCQGVGVGTIGFWERKICPDGMVFDFINQECRVKTKKARKQQVLNIAILNNSCAKGETCIGGTVCDLDTLKCLCPYGTTPHLGTLSCESSEPAYIAAELPAHYVNGADNSDKSGVGFLPNSNSNIMNAASSLFNSFQSSAQMQPFKFSNFPSTGSNLANNGPFNFNWNQNQQNQNGYQNPGFLPSPGNSNSNNFTPKPANPFASNNGQQVPSSSKKIPILAPPGKSCRNNEVCIGGSICTLPIGLCLCPGELEERDGECVLPPRHGPAIHKVGIGAVCNEMAECDDGSTCVLGRCTCVAPLVQHEGKCVLKATRKEVDPPYIAPTANTHVPSPRPQTYTYRPPAQTAAPQSNNINNYNSYINAGNYQPEAFLPASRTTERPTPSLPRTTQTPYRPPQPPTVKPMVKPNPLKMGGSKQAGVGVRCSLNTDCMIGAYCNGNTNPPSCQCLSTHVNIEGRCEKAIFPGQVGCKSDEQCRATDVNTSCIDRICVCEEGKKAVDSVCVNANDPVTSPPGGSCSEARECTGGSVCREGWCICPDPHMIVQKGICIQSGIRPTLPPKQPSHPATPTLPAYQTAAPIPTYRPKPIHKPTVSQPSYNSHSTSGRKAVPGSSCGPLDTCVGGSTCIDNVCICPLGMEPTQSGRCEKSSSHQNHHPHQTVSSAGSHKSNNKDKQKIFPASASKPTVYSQPGGECGNGQVCTGGSSCNSRNICMCPADRPKVRDEECVRPEKPEKKESAPGQACDDNSVCIRGSTCINGYCRCGSGYVAVAGYCASVPQTTTNKALKKAKPLESCDGGEACEGGSDCDDDTGICMCPRGQIVFGSQCMDPPTKTTSPVITSETKKPSTYQTEQPPIGSTECESDANCGDNKICLSGRCKCMPGFIDNLGLCEPLESLRPRLLKYGQPCDRYSDRCTNGAKCIDAVCKCPSGFALSPSGWCERYDARKGVFNSLATSLNGKPFFPNQGQGPSSSSADKSFPTPTQLAYVVASKMQQQLEELAEQYGYKPHELPKIGGGVEIKTKRPSPTPMAGFVQPSGKSITKAVEVDHVDEEEPNSEFPNPQGYGRFVNAQPIQTRPTTRYHSTQRSTRRPSTRITSVEPQTTGPPPSSGRRKIPIGYGCDPEDECQNGSECRFGFCRCPDGKIEESGSCIEANQEQMNLRHAGESCDSGAICIGGAICDSDSRKCICGAGHVAINGVCKNKNARTFVLPGDSCRNGEGCSGNSFCKDGMCECEHDHFVQDGYCRHIASHSSQIQYVSGAGLRFSSKIEARPFATSCNEDTCHLPDCFCSQTGKTPPGDLPPSQTPQFIVLTFDDAVNGKTFPDYLHLFQQTKYRNPNGCPIKATFFISHEWTNYDSVQWISAQGMELASNSISHVSLADEDSGRWLNEMDGQRRIMAKFAGVPEESIVGMRAPQLAAGADSQFEMMTRAGFIWDNTLSANPGINSDPFWPQTLDHRVPWNCHEQGCPQSAFPGIWEIPLNQFYGSYMKQIDSYRRSSMIRAAVDLNNTVEELTAMLVSNFDRAYSSNKAPFVLSLNADFLQLNGKHWGMQALERFLNEVMANKDVYVVTMKQLVDWMKNPTPLSKIDESEALRCPISFRHHNNDTPLTCETPNKCMYRTPGLNSPEHQFLTCAPCPDLYPWIENPSGTTSILR